MDNKYSTYYRVRQGLAWGAIALLSCLSVVGGGCRQNPDALSSEERVAAEVGKKLDSWRARREAECLSRALKEAQLVADTLIRDYAFAKHIELERPVRPPRPTEPPLLRPNDTLKLRPFLKDTL